MGIGIEPADTRREVGRTKAYTPGGCDWDCGLRRQAARRTASPATFAWEVAATVPGPAKLRRAAALRKSTASAARGRPRHGSAAGIGRSARGSFSTRRSHTRRKIPLRRLRARGTPGSGRGGAPRPPDVPPRGPRSVRGPTAVHLDDSQHDGSEGHRETDQQDAERELLVDARVQEFVKPEPGALRRRVDRGRRIDASGDYEIIEDDLEERDRHPDLAQRDPGASALEASPDRLERRPDGVPCLPALADEVVARGEEDHRGEEGEIRDEQGLVLREEHDERSRGRQVHDDGRVRRPPEPDVVETHADGACRRVGKERDLEIIQAWVRKAVIREESWHGRPRRRSREIDESNRDSRIRRRVRAVHRDDEPAGGQAPGDFDVEMDGSREGNRPVDPERLPPISVGTRAGQGHLQKPPGIPPAPRYLPTQS